MAKVTITITDLDNNKVSVVVDPSVETFFKMDMSGETLTSAQGYAMAAVNEIRRKSKDQEPLKILLPKVDAGSFSI